MKICVLGLGVGWVLGRGEMDWGEGVEKVKRVVEVRVGRLG